LQEVLEEVVDRQVMVVVEVEPVVIEKEELILLLLTQLVL
tara:strand:+ start:127 stop:246 length:120 start_codon:yes stop_codon:yes gene_type:complete